MDPIPTGFFVVNPDEGIHQYERKVSSGSTPLNDGASFETRAAFLVSGFSIALCYAAPFIPVDSVNINTQKFELKKCGSLVKGSAAKNPGRQLPDGVLNTGGEAVATTQSLMQ